MLMPEPISKPARVVRRHKAGHNKLRVVVPAKTGHGDVNALAVPVRITIGRQCRKFVWNDACLPWLFIFSLVQRPYSKVALNPLMVSIPLLCNP